MNVLAPQYPSETPASRAAGAQSPRALYEAWVAAMESRSVDRVLVCYQEESSSFWGTLADDLKFGREEIRAYFDLFLDRSGDGWVGEILSDLRKRRFLYFGHRRPRDALSMVVPGEIPAAAEEILAAAQVHSHAEFAKEASAPAQAQREPSAPESRQPDAVERPTPSRVTMASDPVVAEQPQWMRHAIVITAIAVIGMFTFAGIAIVFLH